MHQQKGNNPLHLMQQAQNGDTTAFGKLYALYYTPVFRYIYYRVKSKEDAEDMTQSVFEKVYSSMDSFKDIGKPPLAYFYTVARNTVIDYYRKNKVIPTDNLELGTPLVSIHQQPEQYVQTQETKSRIHQAIQCLTEDQKEVVILKFINELSNKEIAGLLQKTEEGIRQLQCRALQHLKKIVYEQEH